MISLRNVIFFTLVFAAALPNLMGGHNDPYIPGPGPDGSKNCNEETTGGSSVPVVKSLEWSVSIGLSSFSKPALDILAKTAYEKNGNLPSFKELYDRSYSDKPIQQRQLHLGFALPIIAEPVFHPSCLVIDENSSAEVIKRQDSRFFNPFIHQVVTHDAFTLVEARPGPTPDTGGGWTVWVWNLPYPMPEKDIKGFYLVEGLKQRIPLTKVTFFPPIPSVTPSGPPGPPEYNKLVYTQTQNTGFAGQHEIEYNIEQTVSADKKPLEVTTTKYVSNGIVKSLASIESVKFSQFGSKVWDYTIERQVATAPVSGSGSYASPILTSSTTEVYSDFSISSPQTPPAGPTSPAPLAGGGAGMKRLMSKTESATIRGQVVGEPQVTRYNYVNQPLNSTCHGRLESQINPDGSWRRFEYIIGDGVVSTITEYQGWKDVAFSDLENCRKEVTVVTPDMALVETYIGSVMVSKSRDTIGKIDAGTINESKTATSEKWDGTAWHSTTTCYGPSGFVSWIENSDGTATTYSYSSNGYFQITTRTGAGSRTGVTAGSQVVTTMSMRYIPIAQETSDIASNLVTERWDADVTSSGGFDPYGRPLKRIYNGNVDDYDINRYACCGLEYSRDRFGKSTQYYRDGLLRIYKTETKNSESSPLITDYTDTVGFTKTRTRSIGGQTLFLGLFRQICGSNYCLTAPK